MRRSLLTNLNVILDPPATVQFLDKTLAQTLRLIINLFLSRCAVSFSPLTKFFASPSFIREEGLARRKPFYAFRNRCPSDMSMSIFMT